MSYFLVSPLVAEVDVSRHGSLAGRLSTLTRGAPAWDSLHFGQTTCPSALALSFRQSAQAVCKHLNNFGLDEGLEQPTHHESSSLSTSAKPSPEVAQPSPLLKVPSLVCSPPPSMACRLSLTQAMPTSLLRTQAIAQHGGGERHSPACSASFKDKDLKLPSAHAPQTPALCLHVVGDCVSEVAAMHHAVRGWPSVLQVFYHPALSFKRSAWSKKATALHYYLLNTGNMAAWPAPFATRFLSGHRQLQGQQ